MVEVSRVFCLVYNYLIVSVGDNEEQDVAMVDS